MGVPELLLTCAVGLEELVRGDLDNAGHEARTAGSGLIRTSGPLDVDLLRRSPMINRVAVPLTDEGYQSAESVCRAAGFADDLKFRVGAKDPQQRADVIQEVGQRTGWENATGDWQVNVDVDKGRIEIGPLAWAARFGTLRRLPATTPPAVAAGLIRLAKVRDGDRLLDPCAGVATIPVIDALVRPDGLGMAIDSDTESVEVAIVNVASRDLGERVEVERGDATRLDLPDQIADRVVADLPFGRKVGSNSGNRELYPAILREIGRVLVPGGRAVLLSDDKRTFEDAVRRDRRLKVVGERTIRYNGVSPSAYTITGVRSHR